MKCHEKVWYFCVKNVFTLEGKCQRWIPVIVVIFTITTSYLIFNFQLFEVVTKAYIRKQIDLLIVTFFLIMYLWSFFRSVAAKNKKIPDIYNFPSYIKELYQISTTPIDFDRISKDVIMRNDLPIQNRLGNGGFRFCHRCMIVKPDRTHHCSSCNQCIVKFDHHCPWINNCVMFTNYKYFLLFLIYGTFLHLSLAINNIESVIDFASHKNIIKYKYVDATIILCFTANFILNFGSLFATFGMLCWHLTLVGRNLTTNESYRSPLFAFGADKKAYNISLKYNFSQIFGSNKWLWFIPVWSSKGDGFVFRQSKYAKNDNSHIEKKRSVSNDSFTSKSTSSSASFTSKDDKTSQENKNIARIKIVGSDESQCSSSGERSYHKNSSSSGERTYHKKSSVSEKRRVLPEEESKVQTVPIKKVEE